MYYGNIKKSDIANGPGVRVSLFVSGCTHHCKGCFNEETWNFKYGEPFTEKTEEQILKLLEPSYDRQRPTASRCLPYFPQAAASRSHSSFPPSWTDALFTA